MLRAYICIEGADGVGKTTACNDVYKYLCDLLGNEKVFVFAEPFCGIETAKFYYDAFCNGVLDGRLSVKEQIFLINTCRSILFDYIKGSTPSDAVIILDRYIPSTLVYQGHNISYNFLYDVCLFASSGVIPSLTCFIDSRDNVDIIRNRIIDRKNGNDLFLDDLDSIIYRYREVFRYLINVKSWNVIDVSCSNYVLSVIKGFFSDAERKIDV